MSTGFVTINCGTSCITFSSCRNRGPSGKDLRQAIECSSVFQRSRVEILWGMLDRICEIHRRVNVDLLV